MIHNSLRLISERPHSTSHQYSLTVADDTTRTDDDEEYISDEELTQELQSEDETRYIPSQEEVFGEVR